MANTHPLVANTHPRVANMHPPVAPHIAVGSVLIEPSPGFGGSLIVSASHALGVVAFAAMRCAAAVVP